MAKTKIFPNPATRKHVPVNDLDLLDGQLSRVRSSDLDASVFEPIGDVICLPKFECLPTDSVDINVQEGQFISVRWNKEGLYRTGRVDTLLKHKGNIVCNVTFHDGLDEEESDDKIYYRQGTYNLL